MHAMMLLHVSVEVTPLRCSVLTDGTDVGLLTTVYSNVLLHVVHFFALVVALRAIVESCVGRIRGVVACKGRFGKISRR